MIPQRTFVGLAIGLILWVATALLIFWVCFGVPVRYRLDSVPIEVRPEHAYLVRLPEQPWPLMAGANGPGTRQVSGAELLEDGRSLGPVSSRKSIRRVGRGRYTYRQGTLLFSTSDNSDPRTNGRLYDVYLQTQLAPQVLLAGLAAILALSCARWLRRSPIDSRDFLLPASLWSGAALAFGSAACAKGIGVWLLAGLGIVFLIWAVAISHRTVVSGNRRQWKSLHVTHNLTLLVASLTCAVVASEALLLVWERRLAESASATVAPDAGRGRDPKLASARRARGEVKAQPEPDTSMIEHSLESFGVEVPQEIVRRAARRLALVTLPAEFGRRPLEVEGAARAFRWHGVVHLKDVNGMRRTTPFPPRRESTLRVMVVGDSLTYGVGIDEQWTYARQLETLLARDFNIEILNLGVSGHQSEDVLSEIRDFLPQLDPDVVIYGVCPNDFLPSGTGQYRNNYAYALPFPESVKTFFTDNSRLIRLSEDAYNQMLLAIGLRVDFFDDILNGFTGYQRRFAQDVTRMNETVTARGLPPVIALVLDQRPRSDSRARQIAQVAEQSMKIAGMDVIEMAPYNRQFESQNLRVSRWEGHPNEVAHAIWAVMLDRHLRRLAVFSRFRKPERRSDP